MTARLEQTALRWLLELLDLPRVVIGAFVTGIAIILPVRRACRGPACGPLARVGLEVRPTRSVRCRRSPSSSAKKHIRLWSSLNPSGLWAMGLARACRQPRDAARRGRAGNFRPDDHLYTSGQCEHGRLRRGRGRARTRRQGHLDQCGWRVRRRADVGSTQQPGAAASSLSRSGPPMRWR